MTSREAQEEKWPATDTERVIRRGHPTDREILRRVAVGRIGQYRGTDSRQLRKYEEILKRIDAAIIADAERHLEYLGICIARELRNLERARERSNVYLEPEMILQSLAGYRWRITEINLQLSEAAVGRVSAGSDDSAGGVRLVPPAYCPA